MSEFAAYKPNTTTLLSWNVKSGGFKGYDPAIAHPARQTAITAVINKAAADNVTLTDAHRWDDYYGGPAGIARHLRYRDARFVRLNDERLNRNHGAGIGIAFATNHRIQSSKELDLDTRQGLGVILDIGRYGLQIASAYFDDLDETVRMRNAQALVAALEPGVPTVITGDLNSLRPTVREAAWHIRGRDMVVRGLAHALPKRHPLGKSISGMNERQVIPYLTSQGFTDAAAATMEPTAPAVFPMFGIDYVFRTDRVQAGPVRTLPARGASDHLPSLVQLRV